MDFITEIEEYVKNNEFSIEMLDYCRMCFQYAKFNKKDCIRFKEILSKKIRACLPELNQNIGEILASLCIDRGVAEINDVIFVDNAVYSEKKLGEPSRNITYIDFIDNQTTFTQSSYDILAQELNKKEVKKEVSNRLAKSMQEIFANYFNNPNFPKTLDWEEIIQQPSFPWITFALNCDITALALFCKKGEEFTFKIANYIMDTTHCCVLELLYSPNKESVLEVISKTDKVDRLSDILISKEKNLIKTAGTNQQFS